MPYRAAARAPLQISKVGKTPVPAFRNGGVESAQSEFQAPNVAATAPPPAEPMAPKISWAKSELATAGFGCERTMLTPAIMAPERVAASRAGKMVSRSLPFRGKPKPPMIAERTTWTEQ